MKKWMLFIAAMLISLSGCGKEETESKEKAKTKQQASSEQSKPVAAQSKEQSLPLNELKATLQPLMEKYEEFYKQIESLNNHAASTQTAPKPEEIDKLRNEIHDIWFTQIENLLPKTRQYDQLVPNLQQSFSQLESSLTAWSDESRDLQNKITATTNGLDTSQMVYQQFLEQYSSIK